MIKKIFRQAKI